MMSLSPIVDSFPNFNVKYLKLLKICQIVMFLEMNIDYAKIKLLKVGIKVGEKVGIN